MNEIIQSWPWIDRAMVVALWATLIFAPWIISRHLERISGQNERIISLLVDIKIGRRDLP